MKQKLAYILAFLWLAAPSLAVAQHNPVVVELFTSQGCSSCPPADALMQDLVGREDVIALSLHVDYWDYIGWKDEFADPAYTRRQKQYAHAGGRKMVYTPQMIVNGQQDVVGARAMELAELIMRHRDASDTAQIRAERVGDRVVITGQTTSGAPLAAPCDIHLVRYIPQGVSQVTRGENAGQTLESVNIAADWQVIGQWDGRGPLSIEADMPGDLPAVVLVQLPGPGGIMAAARVK